MPIIAGAKEFDTYSPVLSASIAKSRSNFRRISIIAVPFLKGDISTLHGSTATG
jgi:hypothetical protein